MKIKHPERLLGVNEDLVAAVQLLKLPFDILIVCGKRSLEEQEELFKDRKSKVRGANSPHVLGTALDIVPLDSVGNLDWNDRKKFQQVRDELSKLIKLTPAIVWDANHFQIKGETNEIHSK